MKKSFVEIMHNIGELIAQVEENSADIINGVSDTIDEVKKGYYDAKKSTDTPDTSSNNPLYNDEEHA